MYRINLWNFVIRHQYFPPLYLLRRLIPHPYHLGNRINHSNHSIRTLLAESHIFSDSFSRIICVMIHLLSIFNTQQLLLLKLLASNFTESIHTLLVLYYATSFHQTIRYHVLCYIFMFNTNPILWAGTRFDYPPFFIIYYMILFWILFSFLDSE